MKLKSEGYLCGINCDCAFILINNKIYIKKRLIQHFLVFILNAYCVTSDTSFVFILIDNIFLV
jgi:hypothetical protein